MNYTPKVFSTFGVLIYFFVNFVINSVIFGERVVFRLRFYKSRVIIIVD